MSDLDLESLACVDALARTLRFRVAAKSVALSPAAFGKRVSDVERALGAQLFFRTTRRVQVTPRGESLLPRIRRLLADAEALAAAGRSAEPPVDVVLGTRHELGMSWLVPARAALKRALPHATVHLRFGNTVELETAVLALGADAIIVSRTPTTRRLDTLPLHEETYTLVASPKLLAKTPLRRAEDAEQHALVDADESLPLYSYARRAGATLRFGSMLQMGTIAAMRAVILAGEGVGVLPTYFVAADLRAKRLVRPLPTLPIDADRFRLIFRADDPKRPLLARMAAVLRKEPLR
jgi:LysR family transcriptional regulator, glycine cleavage system transcriptional activator